MSIIQTRLSNIKSVSDYLIRETSSGRVRGLEYDPNDERTFNLIGGLDNNATHDAALFFGILHGICRVAAWGEKNIGSSDDH